MYYINLFIITALEVSCLLILWFSLDKNFFKAKDKHLYKRIFIIFSTTCFVTLTKKFNVQYGLVYNYIFFILFMVILFKKKFLEALAEFCIAILGVFLLQFISVALFRFADYPYDISANFTAILLIHLILLFICHYIYYLGFLKKLMDILKQNITTFYFVVFNILFYILAVKWFLEHRNPSFIDNLPLIMLAPLIFIGGNFAYTLYSIRLKEQANALETYNKYLPKITQMLDETRRRQHDFKNHLNTINGIIQYSEDIERKTLVKDYITSLNNSFANFEGLIHIENKILAAIVYNKLIDADRLNIDFNYKVHPPLTPLPLKDYELSEVLNNLLDNAFEATKHNDDSKEVVFNFYSENNTLTIEVKNTGNPIKPDIIKKMFTKGFTTKEEKGHGYGLFNVKKIVDSYHGKIELSYENNCNIFKILFNL